MKIKLTGPLLKPSISKSICRQAIKFYATLLMSKKLLDSLEIEVKFQEKDDFEYPDDVGTCCCIDNETRPKIFEIEVRNNMGFVRTLKTIAHEMVHVEQSATNRLHFYHGYKIARMGGVKIRMDKVEYWDQEWEIEAAGREHGLYRRFVDFRNGEYKKLKKACRK